MYEHVKLFLGRALTLRLEDLKPEDGQGVTEYGLAVAFVVFALVGILALLSSNIRSFIQTIADQIGDLPGAV